MLLSCSPLLSCVLSEWGLKGGCLLPPIVYVPTLGVNQIGLCPFYSVFCFVEAGFCVAQTGFELEGELRIFLSSSP